MTFCGVTSVNNVKNFRMCKCCGLPSNEEAEKGASFARQTEIVNCRLRDETPAAIIIKANIHNIL